MHVHVHVQCTCMCVYVHVHVCVHLYIMHVHVPASMCVRVYVCAWVYACTLCVFICTCMYMYMYVCACVCMYMYMYVCVHVCVYAYTCYMPVHPCRWMKRLHYWRRVSLVTDKADCALLPLAVYTSATVTPIHLWRMSAKTFDDAFTDHVTFCPCMYMSIICNVTIVCIVLVCVCVCVCVCLMWICCIHSKLYMNRTNLIIHVACGVLTNNHMKCMNHDIFYFTFLMLHNNFSFCTVCFVK